MSKDPRRRALEKALEKSAHPNRLRRAFSMAVHALGDEEKAARWMQKRNLALGGVTPLYLLDTEPGAEEVHNVLGAIMYGGVV